jgi:hypothetical protein
MLKQYRPLKATDAEESARRREIAEWTKSRFLAELARKRALWAGVPPSVLGMRHR